MKNLITAIFLLFSLAMFGQDWQLDGTKYPNATNEGDTVSLATKVPLWDADNLQNYFADLGDILALNPVPPTPTLQSVTDEGSETTNNINIITGGGSGQRIQYSSNNIYYFDSSGLLSNLSFDTNASIGGGATRAYVQLAGGTSSLLLDHSQNASNPSASILAGSGNRGRLGIAPAINDYEAVTLGQMQDSISSHTPDLSDYVDRTTNQEVFGQKTWQDINLFNSPTLFNDRIEVGRIGMNPTLGGWAYNNGGSFSYTTDDMFTFRPMGASVPAGSLDFTNLTSDRRYEFPNKSGELVIQETGTFVPTLTTTSVGSNVTDYSVLEAYYSKVGSQVHVVVYFTGITTDGDVTNLQVGNLPYSVRTGFLRGGFGQAQVNNTGSTGGSIQAYSIVQGGNVFISRNETGYDTKLDVTFTGGNASFSVTYITND